MLQNLLSKGRIGNLGGLRTPATGAKPGTTKFPMTLNVSTIAGVGVTFTPQIFLTTDFGLACYYTVRAQEDATFGFGSPAQPDNQGYIYQQIMIAAGPALIQGLVRYQLEGAHGEAIPGGLVMEKPAAQLNGSATDRRLMVPLPEWPVYAKEDSRLAIRLRADATVATSTLADSTVRVPMTVRMAVSP